MEKSKKTDLSIEILV